MSDPHHSKAPSPEQLSYLRSLAMQRGETFAYPQTGAEAGAEIDRLLGRRRGSQIERRIEREQVSRDMASRGDGASVRRFEVAGYGSSAEWAERA